MSIFVVRCSPVVRFGLSGTVVRDSPLQPHLLSEALSEVPPTEIEAQGRWRDPARARSGLLLARADKFSFSAVQNTKDPSQGPM